MRILFLPVIAPDKPLQDAARLASARYRALIPAEALRQAGHDANVMSFALMVRPGFEPQTDAVVLSQPKTELVKQPKAIPLYFAALERLKQRGIKIVVDVSDFKLGSGYAGWLEPVAGPGSAQLNERVLRQLFAAADAITVPTAVLGEKLAAALSHPIRWHVVPDPVEIAPGTPRFAPGEPLKLLWFGSYGQHIHALDAFLKKEAPRIGARRRSEMVLVTDPLDDKERMALHLLSRGDFELRAVDWSVPVLAAALAACDIVVMPFRDDTEITPNKSNNRAVQAMQAGRYVVANSIPSYDELADCCHVGPSIADGIFAALDDPAMVMERLKRGQARVAAEFSPEVIGRRWEAVLKDVTS